MVGHFAECGQFCKLPGPVCIPRHIGWRHKDCEREWVVADEVTQAGNDLQFIDKKILVQVIEASYIVPVRVGGIGNQPQFLGKNLLPGVARAEHGGIGIVVIGVPVKRILVQASCVTCPFGIRPGVRAG